MRLVPLLAIAGLAAVLPALTRAQSEGPRLAFPLACVIGQTCEVQHYVDRDPGPAAVDYRCGPHTYDKHNGIDIRLLDMGAQKRGVDVLAAAPGRVARLRDGEPDLSVRTTGIGAVANKECGNGVVIDHGEGWETQYCHLARSSVRVKAGDVVQAGTLIGKVGLSGETEYPHLHMTVRHAGKVVDPFAPNAAPGTCVSQAGLWTADAAERLVYKRGTILNVGFADTQLDMNAVETGGITPPTVNSALVIAYVRTIAMEAGDNVQVILTGPDGAVLARSPEQPAMRWRAQDLAYVGKRRPATGWPPGEYRAVIRLIRGGKVHAERKIAMRL